MDSARRPDGLLGYQIGPPQILAASPPPRSAESWGMSAPARSQKTTFAELREQGVCGILIYCADYHWSHSQAVSADRWPDDARLSDLEPRFVCNVCGKRGADVRPDFNWNRTTVGGMGYR